MILFGQPEVLEGEGSFGIDKRASTKYKNSTAPNAPFIKLSMTDEDEDVVKKFGKIVQKEPFRASKLTQGGKVEYIVSVGKRETLYYLLPRILPYMGVRRAARIQELIDLLEQWREWMLAGGRNKSAVHGGEATAKNKKS